jgi:hypothetical protein
MSVPQQLSKKSKRPEQMPQNAGKRQCVDKRQCVREDTFPVDNKGQTEQWTTKQISDATKIDVGNVQHLLRLGFEFVVGPDGKMFKREGKDFNRDMHNRFGTFVGNWSPDS